MSVPATSSKLYCYEQWLREDVRIEGSARLELQHLGRREHARRDALGLLQRLHVLELAQLVLFDRFVGFVNADHQRQGEGGGRHADADGAGGMGNGIECQDGGQRPVYVRFEGLELPAQPAALLQEAGPAAALQLLGLLQRDGRFIDFIQEDVAAFSDADIGAAARVVHEGCRKVVREHFTLDPVRSEAEGARVTLEQGFDAASVRLTGNVVGDPPFQGTLTHKGWIARETKLPKLAVGHNVNILAPAEVEL